MKWEDITIETKVVSSTITGDNKSYLVSVRVLETGSKAFFTIIRHKKFKEPIKFSDVINYVKNTAEAGEYNPNLSSLKDVFVGTKVRHKALLNGGY